VGGFLGAILTGVFADPAINELGKGLLYGNPKQLWIQFVASLATIAYSGVVTLIIFLVLKFTTGIRVSHEDEVEGLDESEHGEEAYNL
jgi:Amt family ammonium transporter